MLAAGALTVSACGLAGVDPGEHTPAPGTETVCEALVSALPEVVDDAVRRDLDPVRPAVAVWGRPPIILRCGVVPPAGVDPTAAVLDVGGVGWQAVPGQGGTFFYTDGRVAIVEVAIPDDYAPEADVLLDLGDAVAEAVPMVSAGPAAGAEQS